MLLALVGCGLGSALDRAAERSAMVERDGLVVTSPSVVAELADRLGTGDAEVEARLEAAAAEHQERTGGSRHQALARAIEAQQRQAGLTRVAWLLDTAGHANMPLWVVGATGYALAVVGGCLLLAGRWPAAVRAGAAAGELALTFYVVHALALRWWYPYATEHRAYIEQLVAVVVIVAGFVLVASAWRRLLPRGPLEGALRLAGAATSRAVAATRGRPPAEPAPAEPAPAEPAPAERQPV